MQVSKIELEIENMGPKEADTLKDYFVLLVASGIHKMKNGRMILYFNENGMVQIGINQLTWKREKCNKKKTISS